MKYWVWLVGLSVAFALLERVVPARRGQPVARRQLGNDLFYLLFNGHFWSVLTAGAIAPLALGTRELFADLSLVPEHGLLEGRNALVQIVAYLVVSDFLQWCVHVILHRVPFLWQFHKVHHSVHEMDWAANFRFHWMELVVYRSLLFVPVALVLGGDHESLFFAYVFATAWGHFNHANVDLGIGPLGYVFNSPRMHLWHHDASDEGGVSKNYGIVLSAWDWIFRTAYWPRERPPQRIGYVEDEEMPANVLAQLAFPLTRKSAT